MQFPIRLVSVNEKSDESYNGDKLAVFVFKIETTENGATETSSMDFKLRQVDGEWKIYQLTAPY